MSQVVTCPVCGAANTTRFVDGCCCSARCTLLLQRQRRTPLGEPPPDRLLAGSNHPPGTARTVAELIDEVAAVIVQARLGHIAVTGTLTDWRTHRYGVASGELVAGAPPTSRLRLSADKHSAAAINDAFHDIGYDPAQPVDATAWGQINVDQRWGLRLRLARIDLAGAAAATRSETIQSRNRETRWPARITTIGLVDPHHGDDARADVLRVLAHCDITIIEHRVPVTGRDAPVRISRALDQLGRDHRPDITMLIRGGGADIDLDVFNHPIVSAAIGRHPRPVITGIGHATNTTHADHAAHTSCITPTAAATHVRDRMC